MTMQSTRARRFRRYLNLVIMTMGLLHLAPPGANAEPIQRGILGTVGRGVMLDCVWSSDDRHFLTLDWAGQIFLWDNWYGELIGELFGEETFHAFDLATSGTTLACAMYGGGILLTDYLHPEIRREIPTVEPIYQIAFSNQGDKLAGTGFSNRVYVWSLLNNDQCSSYTMPPVFKLQFSPCDQKLAIAAAGRVALIDLVNSQIIWSQSMNGYDVDFSPDGETLVVYGSRNSSSRVFVFRASDGNILWEEAIFSSLGGRVHFYDNEQIFVISEHELQLYNYAQDSLIRECPIESSASLVLDIDLQHGFVKAASVNGIVQAWTIDNLALVRQVLSHETWSFVVNYLSNSERIFTFYAGGRAKVVDLKTDDEIVSMGQGSDGFVSRDNRSALAFDQHDLAAITKEDGRIYLYNLRTGELLRSFASDIGIVRDLKSSPDQKYVACSGDQVTGIFTLPEFELKNTINHAGTIDWLPDNKHLILVSFNYIVYDAMSGAKVHTGALINGGGNSDVSPDGKWLVVANSDLTLYELYKPGYVYKRGLDWLSSNSQEIPASCKISPQSDKIIIGGNIYTNAMLYDLATGDELIKYDAGTLCYDADFNADGSRIFVAGTEVNILDATIPRNQVGDWAWYE